MASPGGGATAGTPSSSSDEMEVTAGKLISALGEAFNTDPDAIPDAAIAIIDAIRSGALSQMDERAWCKKNLFHVILTGLIRLAQQSEGRRRVFDETSVGAVEACGVVVKTLAEEKSSLVADLVLQLCLEYLICDEARPHVQSLLLLFVSTFCESSSKETQDELTYFLVHFVGTVNCQSSVDTPSLSHDSAAAKLGSSTRSYSPTGAAAAGWSMATMGLMRAASKKPNATTAASMQAAMHAFARSGTVRGGPSSFFVPRLDLPRAAVEQKRRVSDNQRPVVGGGLAVSQSLVRQLSLAHGPQHNPPQGSETTTAATLRELTACGHKIGQLYVTLDVKLLLSMKMEMEALSTAAVLQLGGSGLDGGDDLLFSANNNDSDREMSPSPNPSSTYVKSSITFLPTTSLFHCLKRLLLRTNNVGHSVTVIALTLFQWLEHKSSCHEALSLLTYSCFHAVERREPQIVRALCDAALATTYRRESSAYKIFRQPTTLVGFPVEIAGINNIPHDAFLEMWSNIMSMLLEISPAPWEAICWTLATLSYYVCNSIEGTSVRIQCGGKCLSLLHSLLELCRADLVINTQFAMCLHYILEVVDAMMLAPNQPDTVSAALYAIFVVTRGNPVIQVIRSYTKLLFGSPDPQTLLGPLVADAPTPSSPRASGSAGPTAGTFFWPDRFHLERHMMRLVRHVSSISRFMAAKGARPLESEHPADYILNPFNGVALPLLSANDTSSIVRGEMLELIIADSLCPACSTIHAQPQWVSTYSRFLYIAFLIAYNSKEFEDPETTAFTRLVLKGLVALCSQNPEARLKALQLGVASTLVQEVDLEQSVSNMREKHMRRTSFVRDAASPLACSPVSGVRSASAFGSLISPRSPGRATALDGGPIVVKKLALTGLALPQYYTNGGDSQPSNVQSPPLAEAGPPNSDRRVTLPPLAASSILASRTSAEAQAEQVVESAISVVLAPAAAEDAAEEQSERNETVDECSTPIEQDASAAVGFAIPIVSETRVETPRPLPVVIPAPKAVEQPLGLPPRPGPFMGFSMPKLSLGRVPPPLYYTSNGDTAGAASTAILSTPLQLHNTIPNSVEVNFPVVALETSNTSNRIDENEQSQRSDSMADSLSIPPLVMTMQLATPQAPILQPVPSSHFKLSVDDAAKVHPSTHASLMIEAEAVESARGAQKDTHPLVMSQSLVAESSRDESSHEATSSHQPARRVRSESSFAVDRGTFPIELLENEPRFMALQRQSRRIYKDVDVHAELLYLILVLIVLPDGSLDPQYNSSYTFNSKRINILFYLHAHMNHDANASALTRLLQRIAEDNSNQGVSVLCKLLVNRAGLSSMFHRSEKLGHGTYGTVVSANIVVDGMTANDVIHPIRWSEAGHELDMISSASSSSSFSMNSGIGRTTVALKLSAVPHHVDDRSTVVNIHHEVLTLMRLQDLSGVCEMYDFGVDGSNYVIVMKKYTCSLLSWRMKQPPGVHSDAMMSVYLGIYRDIVAVACELHARDIVHNDLKLDNVLMERDPHKDGQASIRLGDFGEAELPCANRTASHTHSKLKGTEATRPPEYVFAKKFGYAGRGDHTSEGHKKADVWAMGCLFFELMAGEPLFPQDDLGNMLARLDHGVIDDGAKEKLLGHKHLIAFLNFVLNVDPFARPQMKDVERAVVVLINQLKVNPMPPVVEDSELANPAGTRSRTSTIIASPTLASGRFASMPEQFFSPSVLSTAVGALQLMGESIHEGSGFSKLDESTGEAASIAAGMLAVNVIRGLMVSKSGTPSIAALYKQRVTHVLDFGTSTRISHHFKYLTCFDHLASMYSSMTPIECDHRFQQLGTFICDRVSVFVQEALAVGGLVLVPSLSIGDVDLSIVVVVMCLSQLYGVPLLTVFSHVVQRVDPNRQLISPVKCLRMALVLSQQRQQAAIHFDGRYFSQHAAMAGNRFYRCMCGDCVYGVQDSALAQVVSFDSRGQSVPSGTPGSSLTEAPPATPVAHKTIFSFVNSVMCAYSREVLDCVFPNDTFSIATVTLTRNEDELAIYGPWLVQLRAAERHVSSNRFGQPPRLSWVKRDGDLHCSRCRMPTHFHVGSASHIWRANLAIPVDRGQQVDEARAKSWFKKCHFIAVPQ